MQEQTVLCFPTQPTNIKLPPEKISLEEIQIALETANGDFSQLPIILSKRFKGLFSAKRVDDCIVLSLSHMNRNYGLIIKKD